MKSQEWILHIDGDAFFASCEVSRRPDLFGKAVVVGEERGIATALTYPAKHLGIKRGDPIFKIKKEYPNVTILSSHFELYRKFAYNLAEILRDEVDKFEAYSIDECFATLVGTSQEVQEKVRKTKTNNPK
jgi:nucleotidyltransferase/DNA polymerase involved in DNA repair